MTITYSKQVLLKRGNASVVSTYTGPLGELVLNTDTLTVGVHDGATAGGHSVASAVSVSTANTAMKGYVDGQISTIIAGAPGALDTLNELANALGNNASFSTTITNSLATLTSNAAVQSGLITDTNTAIGTANTAMKGYVDGQISTVTNSVTGANAAIVTANTAMKGYVDANAATQLTSINNITNGTATFGNVIPSANVTYSLGSPTAQWKDLFVGNITLSDNTSQITAYAGGVGHMTMIDANRTDVYVETGTADRPFKTMAAAMAAVAIVNPTGVLPYTFVLMGCTVNENIDFTPYNFNFITFATTCRSVVNGTFTAGNSNLKQLVIRNIEFANTFTLAGDATAGQFANTSLYNVSFSGAFNATTVNNLAFYEVAFFGLVVLKNINYVYTNGAQFNTDLTFTVDDSGATAIPSNGIAPMIIILFSAIANNVYMTHVGTGSGFIVFQPHMSRMGLSASTYTIPTGFVFQPQGCAIRGTWVNNGSVTLRDSSFDVAVTGTAPAYTGVIGGDRVVADKAPTSSKGATGDRVGMLAASAGYIYACTADWTNGVADIWSRTAITATTW